MSTVVRERENENENRCLPDAEDGWKRLQSDYNGDQVQDTLHVDLADVWLYLDFSGSIEGAFLYNVDRSNGQCEDCKQRSGKKQFLIRHLPIHLRSRVQIQMLYIFRFGIGEMRTCFFSLGTNGCVDQTPVNPAILVAARRFDNYCLHSIQA